MTIAEGKLIGYLILAVEKHAMNCDCAPCRVANFFECNLHGDLDLAWEVFADPTKAKELKQTREP